MLPQTGCSSFHGVQQFFRLDGMKFFKNIQSYGLAVLPQTRPSSIQSVKKLFRLNVTQPHKNIQVYGWAALPNIPCHGPAHFTRWRTLSPWSYEDCQQRSNQRLVVLSQTRSSSFHCVENNLLVGMVWNFSETFKIVVGPCFPKHSTVGRAPPNTVQLISRCWSICSSGSYAAFQLPSNFRLGRSYFSTTQCFSRC